MANFAILQEILLDLMPRMLSRLISKGIRVSLHFHAFPSLRFGQWPCRFALRLQLRGQSRLWFLTSPYSHLIRFGFWPGGTIVFLFGLERFESQFPERRSGCL